MKNVRNYGEEIAYWYLRLNGFFLVTNFVVHKSPGIEHSADCDILGVRPPGVFEPVGGRAEDWDPELLGHFRGERTIGVLCEVKTGEYREGRLFSLARVRYALGRIGFAPGEHEQVAVQLKREPVVEIGDQHAVATLLIAPHPPARCPCLFISSGHAERFIAERVRQYPAEKFSARHFFQSGVFQYIISQNSSRTPRARSSPDHADANEASSGRDQS